MVHQAVGMLYPLSDLCKISWSSHKDTTAAVERPVGERRGGSSSALGSQLLSLRMHIFTSADCPPVIGMQGYRLLAQPMMLKKMMEHTYNGIGALHHINSLIDQVVHLSGKGLTTHRRWRTSWVSTLLKIRCFDTPHKGSTTALWQLRVLIKHLCGVITAPNTRQGCKVNQWVLIMNANLLH